MLEFLETRDKSWGTLGPVEGTLRVVTHIILSDFCLAVNFLEKKFRILDRNEFPRERIRVIYRQLCGIYRFRHGDNQLELLFDGRTHFEKFQEDWITCLLAYVRQLGANEPYVKTLLRMTLLYDTESRAEWAENHCKGFINQFFDLKVIKRQGELRLRVS